MRKLVEFARLFIFSPGKAAEACGRPGAWMQGLRVGLLFIVIQVFVSSLNPLSFMDPTAPLAQAHNFGFWLTVGACEPLLMCLSIFFTVLLFEWMRTGWLPLKTAAATMWCAFLIGLTLVYARSGLNLSKAFFLALLCLWLLPTIAFSRRIAREQWLRMATFLLGLSVIQIICLILELAVVAPTRSTAAFYAVCLTTLLWMLGFFGAGMRQMTGTSSARSVLAFIFAMIVSSVFPILAYLLGLMPKEVLKVILFV